jgi:hypothetical protein
VIRAPVAAPKAKAHAERGVGSVRRECLDWLMIISRKHLERVLREYVQHYNTHRPNRAPHPCANRSASVSAPGEAEF